MTTATNTAERAPTPQPMLRALASPPQLQPGQRRLLSGLAVAVALLGTQTLAASTPLRSDVRLQIGRAHV